MDSLTQIVLGAACGEAVLGKKIGNKALLFGAIGGTIPDLDVFVGSWLYGNEIDAMLFHRGFMHSILFSVFAAIGFGWLTFKFYDSGRRKHTTTLKDWKNLFFWSLFTHPILDCFTPYGTQLFTPFTNYRVALNNIAVVDPIYTLPFLLCLIVMMFFRRTSNKRRFVLKLGIGISSAYLLFTFGNKLYMDSVFKKSLELNKINFNRGYTQPTIFNNILWYGVAETDSTYWVGYYSLLDKDNLFSDFRTLKKERALSADKYRRVKDLAWFSNQYYSIYKVAENEYQYNDLRYPVTQEEHSTSSVFRFLLYDDEGELNMKPFERNEDNISEALNALWTRMKGK
ncbi:metal-dependent hydrolase [Seonamhaeicola sediminis]|uniref:Metal-dependent hydrolase n=1 Tax=Seonamhaeicola sediminis TaxID=2528206 RepID=A0A562YEK0_9FLAO|nr:metal-dependent hydrolase [Seonamhaeicola sediminis]TWO33081.1 metal-dependent hydrolase [Seonamhaeicola sediminis]